VKYISLPFALGHDTSDLSIKRETVIKSMVIILREMALMSMYEFFFGHHELSLQTEKMFFDSRQNHFVTFWTYISIRLNKINKITLHFVGQEIRNLRRTSFLINKITLTIEIINRNITDCAYKTNSSFYSKFLTDSMITIYLLFETNEDSTKGNP